MEEYFYHGFVDLGVVVNDNRAVMNVKHGCALLYVYVNLILLGNEQSFNIVTATWLKWPQHKGSPHRFYL